MSQIIIDNVRKYRFRIGFIIKIGSTFLEIQGIEPLQTYYNTNTLTTLQEIPQSFQDELTPSPNYVYWIEFMGIDGALGFQLLFPQVPHWTVHGEKKYLFRHRAGKLNPAYVPHLITNPNYPRLNLYNPEATSKSATVYWIGERFRIREVDPQPVYTELTNYAEGGIGEG